MNKEQVYLSRRAFYREILTAIHRPPSEVDMVMGQDGFYAPPSSRDGRVLDAEFGNLVIDVEIKDATGALHAFTYSIYQFGAVLKIGILFYGSLLGVTASEASADNEFGKHFWQDVVRFTNAERRGESILVEWEFSEPHLYESWVHQEKYTLGMRHLHFRLLRAVCEYLERRGMRAISQEAMACDEPLLDNSHEHQNGVRELVQRNPRIANAIRAKTMRTR